MWVQLTNKLKSMLGTLTLLQTGAVYDYEVEEFGKLPAITIIPSPDTADYRSTSDNERIYAFSVQVWVDRSAPRTPVDAENALRDLVDAIQKMFDKHFTLGASSPGSALVVPTGYTMIMVEAAPSAWFYSQREKFYRGAEIKVKVRVDVNVTLIS